MNTHIITPVDSINKEIHNLQKRIGITEYGKIKLEVLQDILKENIPEQLFTLKQCVEAVNFWSMIKIPEDIILKHLKGEIK